MFLVSISNRGNTWQYEFSYEEQNIYFWILSDEMVDHLIENYFPFEFPSWISTSFTVDLLGIYVYAANNSHLQSISQLKDADIRWRWLYS